MASVSCIIPVFNAAQYLGRAVHSLLDCGLEELEIVIVDDGSTDGSIEAAQELEQGHPAVRFRQHGDCGNHGVSATRNLGIVHSSGELICFLDADDYVYPHRFESALEILQRDELVDGVYQLAELGFATPEAKFEWFPDSGTCYGIESSVSPDELLEVLLRGKSWHTSAVVVRRQLLDRTGLFEPSLSIAEDCHLWFRMAAIGTLVSGDTSRPISVYWRNSGSAFQPDPRLRIQMLRAMLLFADWCKRQRIAEPPLAEIMGIIRRYAVNGVIAARSRQESKLAWWLVRKSWTLIPSLSLDSLFLRQCVAMSLGQKVATGISKRTT